MPPRRVFLAAAALLAAATAARADDLFDAVNKGDVVQARKLLDGGANVNGRGEDDQTPLHRAAIARNPEMVALLLARGADVKARTKQAGFTALHRTVLTDVPEIVAQLLAGGADPDGGWSAKALRPNATPLWWAARNGYVDVARLLLAKGANVNARDRGNDEAPLMMAAERGDHAMLRLLLARGANPNDGSFHHVLMSGRGELIDLFLARKVQAGTADYLRTAATTGRKDLVELILDRGAKANGSDALRLAARGGHVEVTALLLARGADPKASDPEGMTPLHEAASKAVAELLLARGAKVNVRNKAGQTPLFLAVQRGDLALAELLDKHGAEHDVYSLAALGRDAALRKALQAAPPPKPKDPRFVPPLHLAARFGQVKTVQMLLDQDVPVDDLAPSGATALHVAAGHGRLAVVEMLLKNKANVSAKTASNPNAHFAATHTPLQLALSGGHVEVVRLLRSQGALPKLEGPQALAEALEHAARQQHLELVRYLLAEGASAMTKLGGDATLLHAAAAAGDVDLARTLLKQKLSLQAADGRGFTPLHAAVAGNHKAMVEFLLAQGARADDNSAVPVLQLAAELGYTAAAEALLAGGADVNSRKGYRGLTALALAAQGGHLDTAKLLVAKGADVKKDVGVLHRAAFAGHRAVVAFLLDRGAEVDAFLAKGDDLYGDAFRHQPSVLTYFADKGTSKAGGTALQAAVAGGKVAVAELLLERSADVNVRFKDGSVPLHLAAALGDVAMVRLLLKRGAAADASNAMDQTPLQVAVARGEEEAAVVLRKK
jgi:ankyrin repeat protein